MGDGDLGGIDRIFMRVGRLADLTPGDWSELSDEVARIMIEDNRKGVLEGKDRYDEDAPPLTYRTGKGSPTRPQSRKRGDFGTTRGRLKGVSDFRFDGKLRRNVLNERRRRGQWMRAEILPNNNLSTKTYQQLDGPRLAPRYDASRVITNYAFLASTPRHDGLEVACAWFDVISPESVPFLPYHFEGRGQKRYDLRGVRQWGVDEVRKAIRKWVHWLVGGR